MIPPVRPGDSWGTLFASRSRRAISNFLIGMWVALAVIIVGNVLIVFLVDAIGASVAASSPKTERSRLASGPFQ